MKQSDLNKSSHHYGKVMGALYTWQKTPGMPDNLCAALTEIARLCHEVEEAVQETAMRAPVSGFNPEKAKAFQEAERERQAQKQRDLEATMGFKPR